jgi:hypothetical protein
MRCVLDGWSLIGIVHEIIVLVVLLFPYLVRGKLQFSPFIYWCVLISPFIYQTEQCPPLPIENMQLVPTNVVYSVSAPVSVWPVE